MLLRLLMTLAWVLAMATPVMAQASNLLAPRRQDEYQGPTAETTSPAVNMMEFINNAAFRANSRSMSEFLEDSRGNISRTAEAFRAKQRQLLNPATTVDVKPAP